MEVAMPCIGLKMPVLCAVVSALALCGAGAPGWAQLLAGDGTLPCGQPYTVASDDTLSRLAGRVYGDAQLYGFIADANWDALGGNPENLRVGMTLMIPCVDVSGQIVTPEQAAEMAASIAGVVAAEGPLTANQLDTLFGPVALFPDPVLSQLLVAVTFPLDVVKAARFVEQSAGLPDSERARLAGEQPWDESVRNLAAAFPDLVTRMSDHIDWTEQAGEVVIAQTDDVLTAIQRLRAKAQANGYLVDNAAQVVTLEGGIIAIAPADPEVVYVPVYNSEVIYSTPVVTPPVYYYDDIGDDGWEDALLAGAIILGAAIILDEIFDDGDWNGWGDWDNDIDIDWDRGDINIDRGDINIDIDVGGDRVDLRDRGDRVSIGDLDRPQIGDGDLGRPDVGIGPTGGASIANDATREAAREKIVARQSAGGTIATLPAVRAEGNRPSASTLPSVSQPSVSDRSSLSSRQSAASRPSTPRVPSATTTNTRANTFTRPSADTRPTAAASRGRSSAGLSGGRKR